MPNLTPIALTEEEHQRLTKIKHRLEAGSWREMLMKLCDLCDQAYGVEQPATPTQQDLESTVEKIIEEKLKQAKEEQPEDFEAFCKKLLEGE